MTTIEARRYEMLVRVREFGEAHRDRFPESSVAGQAFAKVRAAVDLVGAQAVSKLVAGTGKSATALARTALIDQMDAIGRTARVLAERTPGLDEKFQRPSRRTDQALLTAGEAFAQHAEAHASDFVALGMPSTFIATLRGAIDTFAHAIRNRNAGRVGGTEARARIDAALESGLAAARTLDVIVTNQLSKDPVTMAVWERNRRVEYSHRPRRTAQPVAATPAASAAALPGGSPDASPAANAADTGNRVKMAVAS